MNLFEEKIVNTPPGMCIDIDVELTCPVCSLLQVARFEALVKTTDTEVMDNMIGLYFVVSKNQKVCCMEYSVGDALLIRLPSWPVVVSPGDGSLYGELFGNSAKPSDGSFSK